MQCYNGDSVHMFLPYLIPVKMLMLACSLAMTNIHDSVHRVICNVTMVTVPCYLTKLKACYATLCYIKMLKFMLTFN